MPLRRLRNLQHNIEAAEEEAASGAAAGGASAEKSLVSTSAESWHREVLAVALPKKPLFPGGLMPVTVHDEKLIEELIKLKKGGCVLRVQSGRV